MRTMPANPIRLLVLANAPARVAVLTEVVVANLVHVPVMRANAIAAFCKSSHAIPYVA